MKPNFRQLSFAFAMLIATSAVAYGQASPPVSVLTVTVPPKTTPTPPNQGSSGNIEVQDEIVYKPMRGAHSSPTALILNKCRAKYNKPVSIKVEWATYYKRTGWWCVFKLKSAH